TGNLTSIRTTILSFLYLATILGLVVAVSYSKVVLLSSIHITVDTGVTASSVFEGGKGRPDFRHGRGGVPLVLSSHPSTGEDHLILHRRRHRKSRHPRQQGEPHLLLILVDGRERQPISKETDKWTSGMCRV
ncbi:hypothetical protein HID58_001711, partial [Brassica napus]